MSHFKPSSTSDARPISQMLYAIATTIGENHFIRIYLNNGDIEDWPYENVQSRDSDYHRLLAELASKNDSLKAGRQKVS